MVKKIINTFNGGHGIRTHVATNATGPEPVPFDLSGNPPNKK